MTHLSYLMGPRLSIAKLSPKLHSKLGCADSNLSFSIRQTGTVLSGQDWTFLSTAKLLVLMFRP